ncbi:MAG: flagellar hook-associated protein FlgK [Pseudomonadota bacterium]
MSLTTALNTAASGLRATSRAAELVAGNVANVATPGYARRDLILTTNTLGGVRIEGVSRAVDPLLIADRRVAEANSASADVLADGLKAIEEAIGEPTAVGSLGERLARFEASLIEAATRPDLDARLSAAVSAAGELARGIANTGREIQDVRTKADGDIATMVRQVNAGLEQVDALNDEIRRLGDRGPTVINLKEQRQQVIDGLSDIVPLREVERQNGQVALFTTGGAVLLEGSPRRLEFTPKGFIEPWMSLSGGALSGLTIGNDAIDTSAPRSLLGEGALQAAFTLRDQVAPDAQASLDAVARDLVERFQDPALDPTLTAGDAGLFTDNGLAFDPVNEEGLAQRLEVNAFVVPGAGGEVWRLRDGIGAVAEGPLGDSGLLTALSEQLRAPRTAASGPTAGRAFSVSDQVNAFLTGVASERQRRDGDVAFISSRLEALRNEEAQGGVDTDDEMQKLLAVEQAYGANARVLQTLDTLFEQLLGIT